MITISLDMMKRLDSVALNIHSTASDPNIKHFDHQLWRLLWKVGQQHATIASNTFNISTSMINYLCSRSEDDMKLLASGALLSFTTLATQEQVETALEAKIDPGVFLEDGGQHEADAAYWSLMARSAAIDAMKATQCFGVDYIIVEMVSLSTDAHLRHLAKTVQEGFTLRFDEELIPEIIETDTLSMAHIKRLVQSLDGGRHS